jgi:hypothetical protein
LLFRSSLNLFNSSCGFLLVLISMRSVAYKPSVIIVD